tara:strand:- start:2998 stop:3207 length:210 start_codon:yes stop_codon:yes gene_type:complete
MKKDVIDIRNYADCELSLIVSNTESLYNLAFGGFGIHEVIDEINKRYIYTPQQLSCFISFFCDGVKNEY